MNKILRLTAVTYLSEYHSYNWGSKSQLLSILGAKAEQPNNVGRLPTRNLCPWVRQEKGKHPSCNK